MSTNFPSSLDSLTNPTSGDSLNSPSHADQHANANDAIEALQAKVGANSSAVTTSHDYKLGEVTSTDKAVGKTATQTLTNKTLTAPQINMGSDATGDMYYRNGSGVTTRLAIGSSDQILSVQSGIPAWIANPSAVDASTTVKGLVEAATAAEITAGTAMGGTGAVLVVTPDALASSTPVFNGSGLTNLNVFKAQVSTSFETAARFTSTLTSITDQANNFSTYGLRMQKGSTYGAGYNSVTFQVTGKASTLYLGSPIFTTRVTLVNTSNSVFSSFFGLGNPTAAATGHTFTVGHAGFKIVKTGGVISLYATQADGVTETASSALTTLSSGDDVDLICKVNSGTNVVYYWRVNGGALSSATTLTTNLPAGTSQTVQVSMSSDNVDDGALQIAVTGASYER